MSRFYILIILSVLMFSCEKEHETSQADKVEKEVSPKAKYIINNLEKNPDNRLEEMTEGFGQPNWEFASIYRYNDREEWCIPLVNNGRIDNVLVYKALLENGKVFDSNIVNATSIEKSLIPERYYHAKMFLDLKEEGAKVDESSYDFITSFKDGPRLINKEEFEPVSKLKSYNKFGPHIIVNYDWGYQVSRVSNHDLSAWAHYFNDLLLRYIGSINRHSDRPRISTWSFANSDYANIIFEKGNGRIRFQAGHYTDEIRSLLSFFMTEFNSLIKRPYYLRSGYMARVISNGGINFRSELTGPREKTFVWVEGEKEKQPVEKPLKLSDFPCAENVSLDLKFIMSGLFKQFTGLSKTVEVKIKPTRRLYPSDDSYIKNESYSEQMDTIRLNIEFNSHVLSNARVEYLVATFIHASCQALDRVCLNLEGEEFRFSLFRGPENFGSQQQALHRKLALEYVENIVDILEYYIKDNRLSRRSKLDSSLDGLEALAWKGLMETWAFQLEMEARPAVDADGNNLFFKKIVEVNNAERNNTAKAKGVECL